MQIAEKIKASTAWDGRGGRIVVRPQRLSRSVFAGIGMLCILFSISAFAQPRDARPELKTRLMKSFLSADFVELERSVTLLGVPGIQELFESERRLLRRAAIVGAHFVSKPWLLLDGLGSMAQNEDHDEATRAMAAIRSIAENLRLDEMDLNEDRPEILRGVLSKVLFVAGSSEYALDLRIQAIDALLHLNRLLPAQDNALVGLLRDGEPRIREAAVELFFQDQSEVFVSQLLKMVAKDVELEVARAAAVMLCSRVSEKAPLPKAIIKTLSIEPYISRLRIIVESLDVSDDQLLDLYRCFKWISPQQEQTFFYRRFRRFSISGRK